MERIYKALLHLYPSHHRERFGGEMLQTFLSAAEQNRTRGPAGYSLFFLREIAGLLYESFALTLTDWRLSMSKYWILGFAVAGLVVASAVTFGWPSYTSQAIIRISPPAVPSKYMPKNPGKQMETRVSALRDQILSRSVLRNMIETYNLYPSEAKTTPMDQLIVQMRNHINIELRADNTISITFSYEDRANAQRVARDVMTRLVDVNFRQSMTQSQLTTQFLAEQLEFATAELTRMEAAFANAAELKEQRRRVEELRKKSATSAAATDRQASQGGGITVESLPTMPEFWSRSRAAILGCGLLAGLLAGFLFRFYRAPAISRTAASS